MKVGAILPNGWTGEYDGWDSRAAWARTVAVARQAERLGYESVWFWDHVHTVKVVKPEGALYPDVQPGKTDEITFEAYTSLSAIAALTSRVRLGQIVTCNGFRNPALLAKMVSTMDTISDGRMDLGIGAGWKEDEWAGYGYDYPPVPVRLAMLRDSLEVITRMFDGDRSRHATYDGRYASVHDAVNVPKPIQRPRVPIMVGGNGPNVTWRLAARFADELNLDNMSPAELLGKLPVIHARCEEVNRDPATLRLSALVFWGDAAIPGQPRIDRLGAYRELGLSRVMALLQASADGDEALESFAVDAIAAGCELEPSSGPRPS